MDAGACRLKAEVRARAQIAILAERAVLRAPQAIRIGTTVYRVSKIELRDLTIAHASLPRALYLVRSGIGSVPSELTPWSVAP